MLGGRSRARGIGVAGVQECCNLSAGSSTHLATLTSDNTWQLYHAGNLSHPEQRFELRLQRRRSLPTLCCVHPIAPALHTLGLKSNLIMPGHKEGDKNVSPRSHNILSLRCVLKVALGGCRGVGVDGGEGRRAVAFAFGPQHSWQRFTVFFLCSDGTLFSLCPVAPFGAGIPVSVVQALTEAASDRDDCSTTRAWLQQVHFLAASIWCIMMHWRTGRHHQCPGMHKASYYVM